jgi:hypothetical protein
LPIFAEKNGVFSKPNFNLDTLPLNHDFRRFLKNPFVNFWKIINKSKFFITIYLILYHWTMIFRVFLALLPFFCPKYWRPLKTIFFATKWSDDFAEIFFQKFPAIVTRTPKQDVDINYKSKKPYIVKIIANLSSRFYESVSAKIVKQNFKQKLVDFKQKYRIQLHGTYAKPQNPKFSKL